MIDNLYDPSKHEKKPRTYREVARKRYLQTAQKKKKTHKEIRKAIGSQLRFVKRDINQVNRLLDTYKSFPLRKRDQKYLMVINTLYDQQKEMYDSHKHSIEDRIVSIHQPHVRPIERFRQRFGFYPREVLADQIYCNRANRSALKEKGIKLLAKPLGRPSAVQIHVSPGERNPIEGKFGQAKNAYGLNRIRARLKGTSESWIACIFLVLNLVKLAGTALPYLIIKLINSISAGLHSLKRYHYVQRIHGDIDFGQFLLKLRRVELKNIC